jgi:hypothetical protein
MFDGFERQWAEPQTSDPADARSPTEGAAMSSYRRYSLATLIAGAVLIASPALATLQSSCPAPCAKPPRYAIFVRETAGNLDANAHLTPLTGTLLKGTRNTAVRVDATVTVEASSGPASLFLWASLNAQSPGVGYDGHGTACADTHPYCTMSMTLWFDIDQLEAAHPGKFVGQPLTVMLAGEGLTGGGGGAPYWATFDAQVVKK